MSESVLVMVIMVMVYSSILKLRIHRTKQFVCLQLSVARKAFGIR